MLPHGRMMGYVLVPALLFFNRLSGDRFSEEQNVSYTKLKDFLVNINSLCKKRIFTKSWVTISTVTSLSLPPNFRLPLALTAAHLQRLWLAQEPQSRGCCVFKPSIQC